MFTNVSEEPATSLFRVEFPTVTMEAAGSSETLVTIYQITRHYIPDDPTLNIHRPENHSLL
jgi:hypothetical protein